MKRILPLILAFTLAPSVRAIVDSAEVACATGGVVRVTAIDTGANDARAGWRYVRGLDRFPRRHRSDEVGPAVRAYVETVLADDAEPLDVRVRCNLLEALSTFEGFHEAAFDVSAPRELRNRRLASLLRAFDFLAEADAWLDAAAPGEQPPDRFLFLPESVPESARESEDAMRAFRRDALREEIRFWRWRFLRLAAKCLTPEEADEPAFGDFVREVLYEGDRSADVLSMIRSRIRNPQP